jgi:Arabinose-binding domain of AraC transcription regulator, N-term
LLKLVGEALGDELLGLHLAAEFDPREVGLVYFVLASSGTLADALARAERYTAITRLDRALVGEPAARATNAYLGAISASCTCLPGRGGIDRPHDAQRRQLSTVPSRKRHSAFGPGTETGECLTNV